MAEATRRRSGGRPVKRSVTVAGHRTSVALEPAFWDSLEEIAGGEGKSLAGLITRIDAERAAQGAGSLAGALRLYVLDHYRARADGRR